MIIGNRATGGRGKLDVLTNDNTDGWSCRGSSRRRLQRCCYNRSDRGEHSRTRLDRGGESTNARKIADYALTVGGESTWAADLFSMSNKIR
jgi:hypothetical protein